MQLLRLIIKSGENIVILKYLINCAYTPPCYSQKISVHVGGAAHRMVQATCASSDWPSKASAYSLIDAMYRRVLTTSEYDYPLQLGAPCYRVNTSLVLRCLEGQLTHAIEASSNKDTKRGQINVTFPRYTSVWAYQ